MEMISGLMTAEVLKKKLKTAYEKLEMESATPQATPTAAEAAEGASPSNTARTEEDKAKLKAKYQEKIEERRREKADEELQKEKEQELKRREDMKSLAKVREQQEQIKMQKWLSEQAKEKEQARRAKEEVKAKLEMDRRERQMPSRSSSGEGSGTPLPGMVRERTAVTNAPPSQPLPPVSTSTSDVCRIQLRLPADKTAVKVMKCTDTLGALRHLVAQDLGASEDKVLLSSVYPRCNLTSDMDPQTMQELQMVPSGVILVRLKESGIAITMSPGGNAQGIAANLWSAVVGMFQLLISLLAFLKKALGRLVSGGTPPTTTATSSTRTQDRDRRVRKFRQEDYLDDSNDSQDLDEDEKKRKRTGTYNGNSTQQQ